MKRILVTGAAGQLGSELVPALIEIYGADNVLATDIKTSSDTDMDEEERRRLEEMGVRGVGQLQKLDCTDARAVADVVAAHGADAIYHLAAVLSAAAEKAPQRAYDLNMGTLRNVLEVAREKQCAVFTPSSIGAFGPTTPRDPAPQDTIQRPTTMYGITKVAGELLCDYYWKRFQVDARGVRFPGLISYVTPPGGGTTDYAVHIFYDALRTGVYTCFLSADTQLDMMYMPDAVRAAIEVMEAEPKRLEHRNAFNVTAMQLTPEKLAAQIRRSLPDFRIEYDIDPMRQSIADSWPRRIDDSAAREEWGWHADYDMESMTKDMLEKLSRKLGTPGIA